MRFYLGDYPVLGEGTAAKNAHENGHDAQNNRAIKEQVQPRNEMAGRRRK